MVRTLLDGRAQVMASATVTPSQPGMGTPGPLRDKAIVHVLFGVGLRRAELVGLDLAQLEPSTPAHRHHDHLRWEAEPGETGPRR